MERRVFIKQVSFATLGALLSSEMIACGNNVLKLDEIIEKGEDYISDYALEGNANFGYRIIPQGNFRHATFDGEEAFVYSKNGQIIGVTIRKNGINDFDNLRKELSNKYGAHKIVYENSYGSSYQWDTSNRQIVLGFTNGRNNTPVASLFSEAIKNSNLAAF